MTADEFVTVGRFGKTYGLHGWLRVNSFTDPVENILNYLPWFIRKNGKWENIAIKEGQPYHGSIIVKLPGIDTPEAAKQIISRDISVKYSQLPKLYQDEYYWHELEGLLVKDQQGKELGRVDHLLATGSNDVLVVKNKTETLIPYTNEVIIKIDTNAGIIVVDWDFQD